MRKGTKRKRDDAIADNDDIQHYMDVVNAKQLFWGALLNMSWRLALTVLVPIIGGSMLDRRLDSAPSWTLAGVFIAFVGGSAAVWSSVKEVNALQAEADKDKERNNK